MARLIAPTILVVLEMLLTHQCFVQETKESDAATKTKPQSIDELLLFFPSKFPTGDWNPKDLQFKDVFFSAQDETRLHGWYCPCDKPRAVLLIAHGNAGHVWKRWPRRITSTMAAIFTIQSQAIRVHFRLPWLRT